MRTGAQSAAEPPIEYQRPRVNEKDGDKVTSVPQAGYRWIPRSRSPFDLLFGNKYDGITCGECHCPDDDLAGIAECNGGI